MTNVLIIGAGNIGITIATMLDATGHYDVFIADGMVDPMTISSLDMLNDANKMLVDATNSIDLNHVLQGMEYVINAGPYYLACDIAKSALKHGVHYFDLTEDVQQTECIRALDDGTLKTALVPQCGLAPGYISIVANHLASDFDEVYDVKMRVGALPINPTNELKYNTTWSVDGLVNEYLHPCNAIKDGSFISIEAMEGYETFNLDGDSYEAFNTSGGLGTMCETWNGKVQNMSYKTVRYPGHHYLMKFLINDMKQSETQLKKMIQDAVPSTNQDVVLIFVEVTGVKNGRFVTENITRKIYGDDEWSGIQKATATGVCVMVEAHRTSSLPQSGFIKQEEIIYPMFNTIDYQDFGGVYKK